ncbi:unnamed protein product [Urochloa decumbens]|uniref:Ubiquitin-like protease family profile domain-containing protein n=1 Tax=Urochloa decumbens TaxID=240449 RepID=A0ABC8X0J6_9POAL
MDSDDTADSMDDFEVQKEHNGQDISDDSLFDSNGSSSSENEISNNQLYKQVLSEYTTLLKFKRELKRKIIRQSMQNKKAIKKPKETFSRFSVTSFSKVVSAVSASKREVIDSHGFSALLDFDKCFVPVKFAKWIAQQVDYKSGDMLISGKVISLTAESVHLVLGLPLGGLPFPSDNSLGRSVILQKFKKQTIPSVMFFVDKLTKEIDAMSDDDVLISFLLVALTTFLCPSASQIPSQKYLGIFGDLGSIKDFDWCGFILSWLFQHIRSFNRGKSSKIRDEGTLGGCLYYLAVRYLDFVDFGPRMLPHDIPRISVWKGNMIQSYSQLDYKSNGCYGLRPMLDFGDTCYSNRLPLLDSRHPFSAHDDAFLEKLDLVSRCKLPGDLKNSICKIIQKHSLNCGLSVNLDLTAISALPYNVHVTITKLMQHASLVDSRSKNLVLDIMKLITEYPHDDIDHASPTAPQDQTAHRNHVDNSQGSEEDDVSIGDPNSFQRQHPSSASTPVLHPSPVVGQSSLEVARNSSKHMSPSDVVLSQSKLQSYKVNHSESSKIVENVSKINESPATPITPTERCVIPSVGSLPGCSLRPEAVIRKCKPRLSRTGTISLKSNIAILREPLCEISNHDVHRDETMQPLSDDGIQRDVILLGDDDHYVPHCISPVDHATCTRTSIDNTTPDSDKENFSPELTQRTSSRVTPKLQSRDRRVRFASSDSSSQHQDIQILAEKSLSQCVRDKTKIGDDMYNKKFCSKLPSSSRTQAVDIASTSDSSGSSSAGLSPKLPYQSRDSSTGGKLPVHGPRRPIKPGPIFQGDYETDKHLISLSASELKNYKAICFLATSEKSGQDAVVVGKVRCTFWALGESLKPDGFVNSFVISAFCYSLFLQPSGQPDQSKSHYFFANIGTELIKDPDEANQDILCRAFQRSHRSRPLNRCNNLYFPILFNNHWSVFIVNIKDRNFVFLDSLHHKDEEYQEIVRDCVVSSFKLHWDKYVKCPMPFGEYKYLYPRVPLQDKENSVDSGVYAMMFLQHWKSPRTVLSKTFDSSDVPRIRVKVANELLFVPGNTGMKQLVLDFQI